MNLLVLAEGEHVARNGEYHGVVSTARHLRNWNAVKRLEIGRLRGRDPGAEAELSEVVHAHHVDLTIFTNQPTAIRCESSDKQLADRALTFGKQDDVVVTTCSLHDRLVRRKLDLTAKNGPVS